MKHHNDLGMAGGHQKQPVATVGHATFSLRPVYPRHIHGADRARCGLEGCFCDCIGRSNRFRPVTENVPVQAPRSLARVLSWLMRTHNAWIRLGFDRCRRGLQALLFTGVWIHGALWGCFRCATSEVSRRFFGDQNASCQNLMACLRFIYPE